MSDSDIRTQNTNSSQNQNTNFSQGQQMAEAAANMKQRDDAKEETTETADRFQDQAREQQRAGADFISQLANNIRNAAHAFEADTPFAARGFNSAAEYVEDAAEKIRNGTYRDLVGGVSDFSQRQPVAFLGLSVLAGFAAVRFFKASGNQVSSSQRGHVP